VLTDSGRDAAIPGREVYVPSSHEVM
jgi:hypothetical protein